MAGVGNRCKTLVIIAPLACRARDFFARDSVVTMKPYWPYIDFAMIFTGLGFVGLWALAPEDLADRLSPGLQIVGSIAALAASLRIGLFLRHRRAEAAVVPPLDGPPRRRRAFVPPREEFGLRRPRQN